MRDVSNADFLAPAPVEPRRYQPWKISPGVCDSVIHCTQYMGIISPILVRPQLGQQPQGVEVESRRVPTPQGHHLLNNGRVPHPSRTVISSAAFLSLRAHAYRRQRALHSTTLPPSAITGADKRPPIVRRKRLRMTTSCVRFRASSSAALEVSRSCLAEVVEGVGGGQGPESRGQP